MSGGQSHIGGPASTGRRVETSPPSQRKTVTADGVNRKKHRAAQAAIAANYSTEQQTLQDH